MIDAKEAVRIAFDYVRGLYAAEEIPHLTLEEVELADNEGGEDFWLVTVSFLKPVPKSAIEAMTGQQGAPTYKILRIRAADGQVHSMKIRTM